jgi:Kyakuja-Dileera-Zisupton transposase
VALGRDTPNWHLRNTCPACFYKLEDEPALKFSFLCEMDGNNSLKWIDFSSRGQVERLDNKCSRSDYWLTPVDVDIFKHEVKASLVCLASRTHDNYSHVLQNDVSNDDLCSTSEQPDILNDVNSTSFSCIDRWRNAGPEQCKRMFAMFAESGIFIVAYRHGNILLACDMIQSGELCVAFLLTYLTCIAKIAFNSVQNILL